MAGGPGRPKGGPKYGGRVKGTPNKVNAEFRDTIRNLLEENAENVQKWLAAVAEGDEAKGVKSDPGRALDLMAKLAEYATPKLNRVEHTGDPNAPVHHSLTVTYQETHAGQPPELGEKT